MSLAVAATLVLVPMAAALPQLGATLPTVEGNFCDNNLDFEVDNSGKVQPTAFNYTICKDDPLRTPRQ